MTRPLTPADRALDTIAEKQRQHEAREPKPPSWIRRLWEKIVKAVTRAA